mmetsp:Transcript_26784/g.62852  ORF Transcript_26784/g.62852 Transcript_26784/m.62852 type:complete len:213 (-) Transcript_26784:90-728(-)
MSGGAGGAPASGMMEAMAACKRVHTAVMNNKDAGPFLEKVDWEAWGLLDYPVIIKQPMDLGLVQRKLDNGEYESPMQYAADVNLVFDNCMVYNQDDSEYYQMAGRLKKVFAAKFSKVKWEGGVGPMKPPTVADKKMFSQNVYQITSEELGKVVQILDQKCESCIKQVDPDDVEIDIDAIDAGTFWEVKRFVDKCVSDKVAGTGAPAAKRARV